MLFRSLLPFLSLSCVLSLLISVSVLMVNKTLLATHKLCTNKCDVVHQQQSLCAVFKVNRVTICFFSIVYFIAGCKCVTKSLSEWILSFRAERRAGFVAETGAVLSSRDLLFDTCCSLHIYQTPDQIRLCDAVLLL